MTEEKMNDHDLLISINAKLTGLCGEFQTVKKENKEAHDKIWDGIEKKIDKTLPSKVFYWVMPFVILGLMAVAGLASTNHYSIGKNQTKIEMHHPKPEIIEQKAEVGDKIDAATKSVIVPK